MLRHAQTITARFAFALGLSLFLLALSALWPQTAAAQQSQLILDAPYVPSLDGNVNATAVQADGKLLIGGGFTAVGGTSRPVLARLDADGTRDTTFSTSLAIRNGAANGYVYSIAALPDGKILIGGSFDQVGSPTLRARHGIARLNADGSLDESFVPPAITPNSGGYRVYRVLPLASGKVLIGGHFLTVGGTARAKLARLEENGALDATFQSVNFGSSNDYVWTLAEQWDGQVLIGGAFGTVGGAAHQNLARLSATGAADAGFRIGVNSGVSRVLIQPGGKVVVAGGFTQATSNSGTSTTANYIARFNANLTVDSAFVAMGGVNAAIHWMEMQRNGQWLIGGDFTIARQGALSYSRSKLARLNFDGSADASFEPPAITGSVWTLAQQSDGRMVVGGNLTQVGGQPRDRLARVVHMEPMTQAQTVDAGGTFFDGNHSCALMTNGRVKCWGNNDHGQLGNGTTMSSQTPVDVLNAPGGSPLTGITAISTGTRSTCALTTGNNVKCWGSNGAGQLGDGTTTNRLTPVNVRTAPGGDPLAGVTAISGGGFHVCALSTGGEIKCWGANLTGQLGDGTTANRLTPVNVLTTPGGTPLAGITAISADAEHTCALTTGGTIKCWGDGEHGKLGDGTDTTRHTPVDVLSTPGGAPLTSITAISAGGSHTCALTTSGGVKCWGWNGWGEVGDGTGLRRFSPVSVLNAAGGTPLTGIGAITTGDLQSCARTTSGGLKCWGQNDKGQLGDGTSGMYNHSLMPVQVQGLTSGVTAFSAGEGHHCAMHSGVAKCWGWNSQGQIGDGSITDRTTPVAVLIPRSPPIAPAYTLTPSVTGGNGFISPSTPHAAVFGSRPTLQIYPNVGYRVDSVTGTCGGTLGGTPLAATFTIAPMWQNCTVVVSFVRVYTVTPSVNGGGGSISPSTPQTIVAGQTTSFTLTPEPGHRVNTIDSSCGGSGFVNNVFTTGAVNADCTVVASFVATHTVTPSVSGGNGSISPSTPLTVDHGQTRNFTLTPAPGYYASVTGTCGGSLVGNIFHTAPITADCTVVASFSTGFTVTPSVPGGHGSIEPSTPRLVAPGTQQAFLLIPDEDYQIGEVTGTCGGSMASSNVYVIAPATADCSVIFSFVPNAHTVTPSVPGGHGGISPSAPQSVAHGSTAVFELTPEAGYGVAGVTGTCGGSLAGNTYTTAAVTANCTVIASFARNPNTAPVLDILGNQSQPAGTTGVQTVPGFASVVSFGEAPWEVEQSVLGYDVELLNDAAGLLFGLPTVSTSGTLGYVLSGTSGSASLRVRVRDDGGTANGGIDTSDWHTFAITVGEGLDVAVSIPSAEAISDLCRFGDYTVLVENLGTVAATGVQVDIPLPASVPEANWTCTPVGGASCPPAGTDDIAHGVNLPRNAGVIYRITGPFFPAPDHTEPFFAQASIAGDVFPDNDTATAPATACLFSNGYEGEADAGE